jgi:hypothetical protein
MLTVRLYAHGNYKGEYMNTSIYKIVYVDTISHTEYVMKVFATSVIAALKSFRDSKGSRYKALHVYQVNNNTFR